MLHLIQKLDRGRWKTVAIATDEATGQDRLERAVGMASTARFRLVAMVDGGERLVRQVDPRLRDFLPQDPASQHVVSSPPTPDPPPRKIPQAVLRPLPPLDPFIPPLAEIPTQSLPSAPRRAQRRNPLRMVLQLAAAAILLVVLVDNVAAVSDRMKQPPTEAPSQPSLAAPLPDPVPPPEERVAEAVILAPVPDPPRAPSVDRVGEEEDAATMPISPPVFDHPVLALVPDGVEDGPVLATEAAPPPSLPIAACRTLAQAQARFASRQDPVGTVQASADQVDGTDLFFRTATGEWRAMRYHCRPAAGGGVVLSEIRLRTE